MKVSAVMPVRGRTAMAKLAVDCFLEQTYPDKELLILEDEDCLTFLKNSDVDGFGAIGINVLPPCQGRPSISEKLNRLIAHATGKIIVRWDSDDWSAPGRIAAQVERIQQSGKAVTGFKQMLFWDLENAALYEWKYSGPDYVLGTSLAFTWDWATLHPFATKGLGVHNKTGVMYGEDGVFARQAFEKLQLDTADAGHLMVARIHKGCSFPKNVNNTPYKRVWSKMPDGFPREVQLV